MMSGSGLRVAMIIQGYAPRLGGAERQLQALAPLLVERGVEVHVLTRLYPGLQAYEEIDGIPVHRLPAPGPKASAALIFSMAALRLLKRLQPQVIHAHELLSPTSTALLARRLWGTPVVAKVLRGGYLGDIGKLKRKPFGQQRLHSLRDGVDMFIAISQEIDAELAEIGVPPERRCFQPNGVDRARFHPLPGAEKEALRARLELGAGSVVIYTGRLAAEKRLDLLLAAWPEVRRAHPNALLLLLGSGEMEETLRQQAGAGVCLNGHVQDVAPYLQAADLFVLPSDVEGFSNALLEALACGLPAVATGVGGAPDIIQQAQNGWLIPPGDLFALQGALLQLLADPVLRSKMGAQASLSVESYALPAVADRLVEIYTHFAEQKLPS